jgi:hypothetical protein
VTLLLQAARADSVTARLGARWLCRGLCWNAAGPAPVPLLPAQRCILLAQEGQCFGKKSAAAFPRFQRSQRRFADKLLPSTRPAAGRSRGVSRAWRPPGGELPQHEPDTHRQCGLQLRARQAQPLVQTTLYQMYGTNVVWMRCDVEAGGPLKPLDTITENATEYRRQNGRH